MNWLPVQIYSLSGNLNLWYLWIWWHLIKVQMLLLFQVFSSLFLVIHFPREVPLPSPQITGLWFVLQLYTEKEENSDTIFESPKETLKTNYLLLTGTLEMIGLLFDVLTFFGRRFTGTIIINGGFSDGYTLWGRNCKAETSRSCSRHNREIAWVSSSFSTFSSSSLLPSGGRETTFFVAIVDSVQQLGLKMVGYNFSVYSCRIYQLVTW